MSLISILKQRYFHLNVGCKTENNNHDKQRLMTDTESGYQRKEWSGKVGVKGVKYLVMYMGD